MSWGVGRARSRAIEPGAVLAAVKTEPCRVAPKAPVLTASARGAGNGFVVGTGEGSAGVEPRNGTLSKEA
jgi:hypothetical protein